MKQVYRLPAFSIVLLIALGTTAAIQAQLPRSDNLSASDAPLLRAEILRIEALSRSTADRSTLQYLMARTWATARQWPETIEWLQKVAGSKSGLDPSRDTAFAALRGTAEFGSLLRTIRDSTPAVLNSVGVFSVAEGDLVPESIAYDPQERCFYLGSMRKGKVVRCTTAGACRDVVTGLGTVLGLKVNGRKLWLLSNSETESALIAVDLASGAIFARYSVGAGHLFNDLVLTAVGDVYLTDTRAMAVWHFIAASGKLTMLPQHFQAANGIAAAPNGNLLYISTFPDGITLLDLRTRTVSPLSRPADLCLAGVDGLYFYRGTLLAIQNGIMSPRVVQIMLDRAGRTVERFNVLERRNPRFEGVTTGVAVRDHFYYMANIQDEKTEDFHPITVLRVPLKGSSGHKALP